MPAVRTRHLGFLGTSLFLHALALGAAALFGFAVLEPEPPATFALTLKPESAASAQAAARPFEARASEELALEDPVLRESGADELLEPLLLESVSWDESLAAFPLAPLERAPLAAVDLSLGFPFLEGRVQDPGSASASLVAAGGGALPNGAGTGTGPLVAGGTAGGQSGAGSPAGTPGGSALAGSGAPRPAGVVAEPVPLETPRPRYPRLAASAGEQGSVLCRLHLGVDGSVLEVEIVESSGHERLDRAAKETVATWRFEPRRLDGQPVTARILHRITFRLTEG